jgi:hypothetical protein
MEEGQHQDRRAIYPNVQPLVLYVQVPRGVVQSPVSTFFCPIHSQVLDVCCCRATDYRLDTEDSPEMKPQNRKGDGPAK